MRVNPSLTARLRIGFGVLFALLLIVSLLGVGRLFQVRVNYEDDITRFFQLELQTERMRSGFVLEQAATRPASSGQQPSRSELSQAADSFAETAGRAKKLASGDTDLEGHLSRVVTTEATWRALVGEPLVRGEIPRARVQRLLTSRVTAAGDSLATATRTARDDSQSDARSSTRNTTILVAAGLVGAVLAALILFTGLINSMRAPLGRLVDGARRLAGGDLRTRVEPGGPIEIAELGKAFNDMADAIERDARERDRVERMKEDFVLTVSHELRTPVTAVKGFAEMLTEQRRSLKKDQYEAVEVIAHSAAQLQHMINDLLDLARSDAGKLRIQPEATAVNPLVQGIAKQMRPNFQEKGQKLTTSVDKGTPSVEADPGRIGQVLANLLTNANKYCQEGAQIRLKAQKNGRRVEFVVSDDGPGMTQEALDHVFERFWRAESGETQSVGGTGLGLAIAKSLVDLHGGEIGVESTPGEGATFKFVLPIAKERKQRRASGKAPARKRTRTRAAS